MPNIKLKQTREPVTRLAGASRAPEPPGSLTWCYVPCGIIRTTLALLVFTFLSRNAVADQAEVVLYPSGCDYFIADGDKGLYLLEWYGGYDPSEGDVIIGDISSYGMKTVEYPKRDREGRVWVEDYLLSKGSAMEQYREHCD